MYNRCLAMNSLSDFDVKEFLRTVPQSLHVIIDIIINISVFTKCTIVLRKNLNKSHNRFFDESNAAFRVWSCGSGEDPLRRDARFRCTPIGIALQVQRYCIV